MRIVFGNRGGFVGIGDDPPALVDVTPGSWALDPVEARRKLAMARPQHRNGRGDVEEADRKRERVVTNTGEREAVLMDADVATLPDGKELPVECDDLVDSIVRQLSSGQRHLRRG